MDRVGFLGCLFSLNRHLHARRFLLAGDCALVLGVAFPQQSIRDAYIRIPQGLFGDLESHCQRCSILFRSGS